uniref:Mono-ADP ribosylhydrolase 2 n=1 Tax=Sarcophilus harrisii TaxID=9305 RepID=A0A7N4PQ47_SARHA
QALRGCCRRRWCRRWCRRRWCRRRRRCCRGCSSRGARRRESEPEPRRERGSEDAGKGEPEEGGTAAAAAAGGGLRLFHFLDFPEFPLPPRARTHPPCFPVSLGNLQLKASHPHGNMYPSNRKKKVWKEEKERLLKMTLEERRKEYLRDYVPLKDIPSWKEEMKSKSQNDDESAQEVSQVKKSLSEKVSLYRGDITLLEIDAIVNAGS